MVQLITDLLPNPDELFHKLLTEVSWETMYHRGGAIPRLIAEQGSASPFSPSENSNTSLPTPPPTPASFPLTASSDLPIYRHPADSLPHVRPFTPTVLQILAAAQAHLSHPLNHVLIQHYRSGADSISPHSDKTLDVFRGSSIVNVSLGAQRTMALRPKKETKALSAGVVSDTSGNSGTQTPAESSGDADDEIGEGIQKYPLPHNSMFILDWSANTRYLHGIKHDNRPASVKSPAELAFSGNRISLTFRYIATFLIPEPTAGLALPEDASDISKMKFKIYGQGAVAKRREDAQDVPPPPSVLEGEIKEQVQKEVGDVIRAFGEENFRGDSFDWDTWYGRGFNVIHFS